MRWYLPLFVAAVAACGATPESNAQETAAAPAAGPTLVVGNKAEDTVSFIDLESGEERARRDTGSQPHEIAVSPDGRQVAVVAYGGTTLDIFDVASAERVRRIDLSPNRRPHGLVWTADNRLVATTEGSDTLTIVDLDDDRVTAIPTGQRGSHMVAVAQDLSRAYVSNMGSGTVSAIDLEAGEKLADIAAGDTPEGLALSPDGATLWVADRDNAVLHAFDTRDFSRTASVEVGNFPIRVAVSPDGATVVTSNAMDGTLTLVDAANREVARTIPVSGEGRAMQVTILFSADGATLYAAETNRRTIAAVDMATGEVLRRYEAGEGSDGLAIAPAAED